MAISYLLRDEERESIFSFAMLFYPLDEACGFAAADDKNKDIFSSKTNLLIWVYFLAKRKKTLHCNKAFS